ncbi:MAG: glycerol-3-phosphate acyltransferase, partial [Monoglobus pectinilyticus]
VAMLFANWWIGLIVLVFALIVMAVSKYVSLGSILGSVLLVILSLIFGGGDIAYILFCVILAVLAVFMHRANIKRLINGTENKLGSKKG